MKIRNCLLMAGLIGALYLPMSSVPSLQPTQHFRFSGLGARAAFDSIDGCIETFADINPINGRIQTAGRPDSVSSVFVDVTQFDNCSQTALLNAFGFADLPPGAFQIDRRLTSATLLETSVTVLDFVSNTSFLVDVSANWTATGPPATERDHSLSRSPGFKSNSTFVGTFRPAAVSGSVTRGGTNFTPIAPVFADLENTTNGELEVFH